MKINILGLLFLSFLLSCNNTRIKSKETNNLTDIEKVENDRLFLDVNFDDTLQSSDLVFVDTIYKTQIVYSAYKRAYKHLSVKNDLYFLDLTSGKDIGISETLFKMIKAGLEDANKQLIELKKQYPDVKADNNLKLLDIEKWSWSKINKIYKAYCVDKK